MKRSLVAGLVALVFSWSGVALTPTSAQADTPGCVSRSELERVGDTNFSKSRVHRIFDTRGRLKSQDRESIERVYKGCRRGSQVGVNYAWRNHAWRWWGHWSYGL